MAAVYAVAAHYDEQHNDAGNDDTYDDADELPLVGTAGGPCTMTLLMSMLLRLIPTTPTFNTAAFDTSTAAGIYHCHG